MVDRYESLIGSQINAGNIDRNMKVDRANNINMEMIKRTNAHAAKMREYLSKYKRNISNDDHQIIAQFKEEQRQYSKDRNFLKNQVQKLEKFNKKDTPQYNFIKKQLIKAVKYELDLEFQLNQQITHRKQQKQLLKKNLIPGSVQLRNAIADIEAKRDEILYLERLINQCLQLLQIIGVLVHQSGEKIDLISERVRRANEDIERAQKNIDRARIQMQKSRCKWCLIIILCLAVIAIGVIIYITAFR